jgi:hypothetical protein
MVSDSPFLAIIVIITVVTVSKVTGLTSAEQFLFAKEARDFTRAKPPEGTAMKVASGESAELGVRARHPCRTGVDPASWRDWSDSEPMPGAALHQLKALSAIYSVEGIQLNRRVLGNLADVHT